MGAASEPDPSGDSDEPGWKLYVFDVVSSAVSVLLVGLLVFSVSGVWPPLVAITSGSMEPHMHEGDLVFVMESDRFPGEDHHESTGVVTAETGERTGYSTFGGPGDVIVYKPNGDPTETPVIHRAMLWVEKDERWVDRADPSALRGATECSDLEDDICPADHAGFITLGDANPGYDQVSGISEPVKPEWVIGKAKARIPYLGEIRLWFGSRSPVGTVGPGTAAAANATGGPDGTTAAPAVASGTANATATP